MDSFRELPVEFWRETLENIDGRPKMTGGASEGS